MTIKDFNEMKRKFDKPSTPFEKCTERSYCVGGAIVLTACELPLEGSPARLRFPNVNLIALCLRLLNPSVSYDNSFVIAENLMSENDSQRFLAAWACAENVLI